MCADAATNHHEPQRLEKHVKKVSKAAVVFQMVKGLPKVWSLKKQAAKIANTLPDYDGTVSVSDSKEIYSWVEKICSTPHRRPGSPEGHQAENWIADKFREFGLENLQKDPVEITVWDAKKWSLSSKGKTISSFYVVNTGFTGAEGVKAPLAYVKTGKARDFDSVDVAGKIVVADVPFPKISYGVLMKGLGGSYALSDPDGFITSSSNQYLNFVRANFIGGTTGDEAPEGDVYWNAHKRGALGICLILRDQPSNSNTHYGPYDAIMKPMPALWIGKYDGEQLRTLAKENAEATLTLDGSAKPGVMHNVWGVLPGMSDEVIMVTSHHDSPFQGAVEDGTGVAQVLAQAKAWSQIPKDKRPRTIVFVIDAGHFYGSQGAHSFARDHKDIMKRAKILITLEHLAAKEVEEVNGEYKDTGKPAFTIMFTSGDPTVIATVIKTLRKTSPKRVASVPSDLFGPAPTSDASGYVLEAGVPVISWIGCPYYLLDDQDTLDKVEISQLQPVAETVTELIKTHMVS